MKEIDDGGLVFPGEKAEMIQFPLNSDSDCPEEKRLIDITYPGITRRDWLAGLAMQGLCANPEIITKDILIAIIDNKLSTAGFTDVALKMADAMIAQSKK